MLLHNLLPSLAIDVAIDDGLGDRGHLLRGRQGIELDEGEYQHNEFGDNSSTVGWVFRKSKVTQSDQNE